MKPSSLLQLEPLREQCREISKQAPEPLSKLQRVFLFSLLDSEYADLVSPLLLKISDVDFADAIYHRKHLPYKQTPLSTQIKILKRALSLDVLSNAMARNNIIFAAVCCDELFAPVLACALRDTITREAKLSLAFSFQTITQKQRSRRVSEAVAGALKHHFKTILTGPSLASQVVTPNPRLALMVICAASDKLTSRDLEFLRPHLANVPDWAMLCDNSRHQALSRYKLSQTLNAADILHMSDRKFNRLLRKKHSGWLPTLFVKTKTSHLKKSFS